MLRVLVETTPPGYHRDACLCLETDTADDVHSQECAWLWHLMVWLDSVYSADDCFVSVLRTADCADGWLLRLEVCGSLGVLTRFLRHAFCHADGSLC